MNSKEILAMMQERVALQTGERKPLPGDRFASYEETLGLLEYIDELEEFILKKGWGSEEIK